MSFLLFFPLFRVDSFASQTRECRHGGPGPQTHGRQYVGREHRGLVPAGMGPL